MQYKEILFGCSLGIVIIYSCSKKLDQPGLGPLTEDELANKKGVEGLLIGAYSVLDGISTYPLSWGSAASNWIYGSVCGTEAYKGSDLADQPDIYALEKFEQTAYNQMLEQKWTAVYDGVERTNAVLRIMRLAKDMSTSDTTEVRAEALFLRAWYYFEAKKMWNDIPFADETVTYGEGNYFIVNDTSWAMIENDLLYAKDNLPETQNEAGRCNKYAAEALLAKAYMFEHKYQQAEILLDDLIIYGKTSSGVPYALLDNYADNFNPVTKNNSESVFAAQMSVLDGSAGSNGNAGDLLNFPLGVGVGGGFFRPSQFLVNHFKTDSAGLPDLDHFNESDVTSSVDTPYAGFLDPRVDWTVGRIGVPYLDWGLNAGQWLLAPEISGPYLPIKNVYYQKNIAEYTNANNTQWGGNSVVLTANNVNLIRFADVLLWAAEVKIRMNNLDIAEEYVNKVRHRMADHREGWVHKYLDDNNPQNGSYTDDAHLAANYKISLYKNGYFASQGPDVALKAVQYERMLELGMEGHRFFDLVRWGIANAEINTYLGKEQNLRHYLKDAKFIPNRNEYFPIPQTEIDKSNGSLKQNPGY